AQPLEPRDDSGHRLLAQGVPGRRSPRPAAVRRHAPLPAYARQDGRRDRGGGSRAAPSPAVRPDEVRHVEPRLPIVRRRAGRALDAASGPARPRSRRRVRCSWRNSAWTAALIAVLPAPPAHSQAPTYRLAYRLRVVERTGADTATLATAVVSGPPETTLRLSLRVETAEL